MLLYTVWEKILRYFLQEWKLPLALIIILELMDTECTIKNSLIKPLNHSQCLLYVIHIYLLPIVILIIANNGLLYIAFKYVSMWTVICTILQCNRVNYELHCEFCLHFDILIACKTYLSTFLSYQTRRIISSKNSQ